MISIDQSAVLYTNLGLSSSALSYSAFNTALVSAATSSRDYANSTVTAVQAAQTSTQFATAVMDNLGLVTSVIGQAAYDALLPALAAYLDSVGVANRGVVVLQLANIVVGLTTDATYGKAAINLVNATNEAFGYSSTATNTTAKVIEVENTPAPVVSYKLTTAADTYAGTSTDGYTSIEGVVSTLSSANTLNATDKIDGGAGAQLLKVLLNSDFAGFSTGYLKNVKAIELTNGSAGDRTFSAKGITGATSYAIDANDAAVTITNMASAANFKLSNMNATKDFTTSFAVGAAETTGTADAVSLELNSVGVAEDAATTVVEQKIVTVTLGSIETANVTSVGGTNDVGFAGTLKKITVSGDAATTVTAVPGTLTSFDASAATGAFVADLTGAGSTAATLTSVKTGAGNDKITVDEVDLTANAVLSGGDGNDTLTLNSDGGTVQYEMSGFETLALNTISGALTVSGTKTTGLTTVSSVAGTSAAVSLVNMGAGDLAVTAKDGTVDAGDISSDNTGAATVNYTASAANVKSKTAQSPAADYTFASAKSLTVNVGEYTDSANSTTTAASAASLVVNVASGKDAAATPAELTKFGGTVTVAKAASIEVNAVGQINGATISAATATAATITNGTTAGTLTLNAPKLEVLTVKSGNTLDFSGSTLTGVQVATVDIAKGTFTPSALSAISSLTVTGAGTATGSESTASVGALGGNNLYGMTVNASGLKGGFTSTSLNVAAGYNISADVSGVTGNVSLGTVGNAQAGKNVSINATGVAGTFAVGNIAATGAVNVDTATAKKTVSVGTITTDGNVTVTNSSTGTFALGNIDANVKGDINVKLDGTVGAVTIGTFTGKSVTVDASDTIGGVTLSGSTANTFTVTALTAADVSVSSLQASTVGITAATASTGLAVALSGGTLVDTVTVTGNATTASLVLTGNLGTGTDAVTVNGTNYTGTGNQTISVSGLTSYDAATLNGSAVKDTIVGGSGVDTIKGGQGQDTLTGGAGADIFLFSAGDSDVASYDTITDFGTTDVIRVSGVTIARAADNNANGADATKAKIVNGVADFSGITIVANQDTLAEKVTILAGQTSDNDTVLFTHDGSTFLFVETSGNDLVIALTGVALAFTTATQSGNGTDTTGLYGYGA